MNYELSAYFLDILMQLIRIQNEQLLNIISEDENIKLESIKHLIISPYEIKKLITKF
jgi:hypothetical protein